MKDANQAKRDKAEYQRNRRKQFPEITRSIKQKYRLSHPDKIAAEKHQYYLRHRERLCAKQRAYSRSHVSECNEYKRKWFKNNPEKRKISLRKYYELNPEKFPARLHVHRAIKAGKLEKGKCCELCGITTAVQGHHHNGYDRSHWLDVQWLCPTCHRKTHRKYT